MTVAMFVVPGPDGVLLQDSESRANGKAPYSLSEATRAVDARSAPFVVSMPGTGRDNFWDWAQFGNLTRWLT